MPYGFLSRYQALRVRGRDQASIALDVFELLVRNEETRSRMACVLVDRWINTQSYNAARENYGFLRMIPVEAWTQQLVNEAWDACELERRAIGPEPSTRPEIGMCKRDESTWQFSWLSRARSPGRMAGTGGLTAFATATEICPPIGAFGGSRHANRAQTSAERPAERCGRETPGRGAMAVWKLV